MRISRTNIGKLLESANSVDMLLYIHDHPYCIKSEIYQNVTRNAHTSLKIEMLIDLGLIRKEMSGKAVMLSLTDVGNSIVDLLLQAEALLSDSDVDENPIE